MQERKLETVVLTPNPTKWIFCIILLLVLVIGNFCFAIIGEGLLYWVLTVMFLCFFWVPIHNLRHPGTLLLTAEGFEQTIHKRNHKFLWQDVTDIGVSAIGSQEFKRKLVTFNHKNSANTKSKKFNFVVIGKTCALEDNFGLKSSKLAELMRQYQNKALNQN